MKRLYRMGGLGLLGLCSAGSLSACADEETGFVIVGNVSRAAPACVARADANSPLWGSGLLDVGLRLYYEASLLVGSQLTPRGDKPNLRTETAITTITGAEVQLYRDDGSLDREFTVPASGVVFPDSAEDPGFAIINATLIPSAAGFELATELTDPAEVRTRVAEVRVFGQTIGGNEIESAPFNYVIRVCEGCLIDFPSSTLDAMGNCRLGLDEEPDRPCYIGQDEAVDCRLCSLSNSLCASAL